MKNSNCGCKILEQILQQIQFTEQNNDLVLLTIKFNRLIKNSILMKIIPANDYRISNKQKYI